MDYGSVYRRCGCRDEFTGRLLGARCPGLGSPLHGSWYFSADLPSAFASRDVVYEAPDPDVTVCLSPARRRDARRPPRDPSKCEVRDEGERSGRC